jgi:hypothetical protein
VRLVVSLGLVMALLACSHNKPVASPSLAIQADCQNVYQYILRLAMVNQVDPQFDLDAKDEDGAEWELDQTYIQDGRKDKFFRFCNAHMTTKQVECVLNTSRIEDINTCIKLGK